MRVLVVIVLAGALLRLFHLAYQSLWVDEVMTLIVATPKPGYPIWQLLRHNIHGPLHTFVVYLVRSVNETDGWLRLPSAVAGTAAIPLMFLWLRGRFDARVALWGSFLLAVNPLHVHYSQELRNYAFAVCFVLAGCVQLDRVFVSWTRRGAALLSVLVAASLLSNFSAAFAFAAQTAGYFRGAGWSRRSVRRWAAVATFAALLVSPWIYRVSTYIDFGKLATPVMPGQIETGERLRGETTFRWESIPYAAYGYSVGFSMGPSLRELHGESSLAGVLGGHAATVGWVALLFGSATLAGLRATRRRNGWGGTLELAAYVVIPLAATLILNWQNAKAFNVRYIIVGLPAYLAFVAAAVGCSRGKRAWIAGLLVAATCGWSLAQYYFDPRYAREDVRQAVAEIESRMEPGDCVFAPTVWEVVQHYQTARAPLHYVYPEPPGVAERQLEALFEECTVFWYVCARPWVADPEGRIVEKIERRFEKVDGFEVPGVEVTRYRLKETSPDG